jgi:hypothetical protein
MTLLCALQIDNSLFVLKPQLGANICGLNPVFYDRLIGLNPVVRGGGSKRLSDDLSGPKKAITAVK